MTQYTPPPPNLDHLNVVQRYMQKGALDRQDWLRLGGIILAYFLIRPYLQKLAKWWFGDEKLAAGEQAQQGYQERRARAKVGANAIRSGKKDADTVIEDLDEDEDVMTSGTKVEDKSAVVNRKQKPQSTQKTAEDELLNWEDEPARGRTEGDKGDVMQWLNKWDE